MHEYDSFNEDVICTLAAAVGEDEVAMVEPMSAHTTFKIGGPADVLVTPRTEEAAARALDVCAIAGVPVTVVGNGSDLLVGDRGIRGVVVLMRDNLSKARVEGTRVIAQAGALLKDVAIVAADAGLSGMEPLWGIPATVGGACFMNAGAYGGSMADVLKEVRVLAPDGSVDTICAADLDLGYRRSRVASEGLVVLSATFDLERADPEKIRATMDDLMRQREEKQPLELPSAGSTFKRPEGHFAGKLIMDAGL